MSLGGRAVDVRVLSGASVVSTRCSETYRVRSACVTLFGFPLWYPTESPRTVIQVLFLLPLLLMLRATLRSVK